MPSPFPTTVMPVTTEDSFWGESRQELVKALAAGQDINYPGQVAGSGFSLRIEQLDQTFRSVTFAQQHAKLLPALMKGVQPAQNTIVEYALLRDQGADSTAFMDEGALPEEIDSTYSREYVKMRYVGVVGRVTHPMTLVRVVPGIENAIARETANKANVMVKQLERACYYGDNGHIPQQFHGFRRQIELGASDTSLNVVDMRGKPVTPQHFEDWSNALVSPPNYAMATDFYGAPSTIADLNKSLEPNTRIQIGMGGYSKGIIGATAKGIETGASGAILFNPAVFIEFGAKTPTAAVGAAAKRPSAPTESVAPAAAGTGSLFGAADAGSYSWWVVARNQYGASAPLALTGPVAVASGQQVTATVQDGSIAGTCFDVYRTHKGGSQGYFAFSVAKSAGLTTVLTDTNAELPESSIGFVFQQNKEAMGIYQLCPMIRWPLATIDTSIRWAQLWYGSPIAFNPNKMMVIKNIGRAPGSHGRGIIV